MAMITIKVPVEENDGMQRGWVENISQHIDAGNSVVFVNMNDTSEKVEINHIQVDTQGAVCYYGKSYAAADAKAITLVAGGWHVCPGVYGITAANTGTSLGIHVRI